MRDPKTKSTWPEYTVLTQKGSRGLAISLSSFLQFMTSFLTPTMRPRPTHRLTEYLSQKPCVNVQHLG